MKETSYKVNMNYDDFSEESSQSSQSSQCLNNPVATITINMENKYGKNMTELFNAFGQANNFNDEYRGRGNIFYFNFSSQKFAKNYNYSYVLDRSQQECVEKSKITSGRTTSNMEFDYVISDMDWKGKNTTITELNNNIAKNIAHCLSHSNIKDLNWNVLRQNYYYIAHNNVVHIYECDNTCQDLNVNYLILPGLSGDIELIISKSFVVDITNPTQNNMNVKYDTDFGGTQAIPLHFPPPLGPLPSYTIGQYQQILEGVITIMTQQFKVLLPEQLKDLDRIAYTTIYNGKLYVSIDYNIMANPLWLEGNGVEITSMYTNTDVSLTDQEIVENWYNFGRNVLTLKNY
jgi:hypothetical protein